MDAIIYPAHNQLPKHYTVFSMQSPIRDPVLLSQGVRGVYDEAFSLWFVLDRSAHLYCIVAVTQLRETEAADVVQGVNACNVP